MMIFGVYLLILRRAVLRFLSAISMAVCIIPYFHQKFNDYLTKITKKTAKKALFLVILFLLKSELYPV